MSARRFGSDVQDSLCTETGTHDVQNLKNGFDGLAHRREIFKPEVREEAEGHGRPAGQPASPAGPHTSRPPPSPPPTPPPSLPGASRGRGRGGGGMWKVSTPVPWPRSGGCGRRAAGPHRKQTRVNGGGGGGPSRLRLWLCSGHRRQRVRALGRAPSRRPFMETPIPTRSRINLPALRDRPGGGHSYDPLGHGEQLNEHRRVV